MKRGFSLVGLIMAVVLIGLLAAGLLLLMSSGTFESLLAWNRAQAFCAAESGVSAAKYYMDENEDWEKSTAIISGVVDKASFRAVITSNAMITSVGKLGNAQWTSIYTAELNVASGVVAVEYVGGLTELDISFFPGIAGDMGQSFTTPNRIVVARGISLLIKKSNPLMSPIYLTLRSTSTVGPVLRTSNVIRASQLRMLYSKWIYFTLEAPISLEKSKKYYIRVSSVPASTAILFGGTGTLIWRYNATLLGIGGYSGGEAWRHIGRNNNPDNKGEEPWPLQHDFNFRVYE